MTRGADLLDEVEQAIRKYTIQNGEHEYRAMTLYVAMSHAAMHLDFAPRLCLTSPLKRCGKSRMKRPGFRSAFYAGAGEGSWVSA